MIEKVKNVQKRIQVQQETLLQSYNRVQIHTKVKKDQVSAKNSICFFLLCTVTLELPMQHDPLYVWKLDASFYASR